MPPAYMRLAELLVGAHIALALSVVAERGIADMLGENAKSTEECAQRRVVQQLMMQLTTADLG